MSLEPTTCRKQGDPIPGGEDGPVRALLSLEAVLAAGLAFDALAALEAQLAGCYADVGGRLNDRERSAALTTAVFQTVEHQRKAMQDVERRLKALLEALLDKRTVEVPGVGGVRVDNPPKKRYDNARVASRLAAAVSDEVFDKETGEMPPVGVVCDLVAKATAEAAGALVPSFTGWRSTFLKKKGITLEDYRDDEPGTAPKVVVTP